LLSQRGVAVCRLSEVEIVSALARLARENAISGAQRDRAVAALQTDLTAWTVVEMTPEVASTARELLLRYTLRAGDAIQLAAALILQNGLAESLEEFVVYDRRLADAARAEALVVGRG
jgi:predicted nucleic acid-binding protein